YGATAAVLLSQPDIGQTALLGMCLAPMLILSGVALRYVLGGGVLAVLSAWAIYTFYPHARERVNTFLNPEGDAAYQVSRALDAIASGGVFGRGPGEGVIKTRLPDAHADFVFAVAAEEFGLIASIGLIAVFGALAFRGLSRASRLNEPFEQLAASGLITLLVAQASIHLAVNLSLLPAKGAGIGVLSFPSPRSPWRISLSGTQTRLENDQKSRRHCSRRNRRTFVSGGRVCRRDVPPRLARGAYDGCARAPLRRRFSG
ncbi:MAG: FtsW/RodA/SpoVE family cell cycle protein, partial [Terricaulis sp.]